MGVDVRNLLIVGAGVERHILTRSSYYRVEIETEL